MSVKREQLVSELVAMGFVYSHTSGSHMIYKHPDGARTIGVCHNSKNKVFGPAAYKQVIKEARQSIELGKQYKLKRA
jgi:predicted RNA binding protein YcfA (HicA-like mRNA interferase family)